VLRETGKALGVDPMLIDRVAKGQGRRRRSASPHSPAHHVAYQCLRLVLFRSHPGAKTFAPAARFLTPIKPIRVNPYPGERCK
jgi:hypothetical protein